MSEPAHRADSSGVAWLGRNLTPQPFAGDHGDADSVIAEALRSWFAAPAAEQWQREADVVNALAGRRLLVGVIPVPGQGQPSPDHLRGDASADLAVAIVAGPGGRALPVFTSTDILLAWDGAARPVPVEAERAALAAVAEQCDELLVDADDPAQFRLCRPALWALAHGRWWVTPAMDGQVVAAVQRATAEVSASQPHLRSAHCQGEPWGGLVVVVRLAVGLDQAGLTRVTTALGMALGRDPVITERVQGLRLVIRSAPATMAQ